MTPPLRRLACAAVLAAALAPAAAQAQDAANRFYVSIGGMYAIPAESDVTEKAATVSASAALEAKSSFGFSVAVGYGAAKGLRGEIELGYRKFDFDKYKDISVTVGGTRYAISGSFPVKGSMSTLSLMANGIYAFDLWRLRPYVGAGIGMARHTGTYAQQSFEINDTTYTVPKVSDDVIVVAYQALAGIAYPLSDSAEARLGYRYFATGEADFGDTQASYATHNFEAGVTFRF